MHPPNGLPDVAGGRLSDLKLWLSAGMVNLG